jgi:hypothetical protein
MFLFYNFFPSFYILESYLFFYIFLRKKFNISDSLIFGYLLSSIFFISINKIFLLLKIIFLYKISILSISIIISYLIYKNFNIIKKDFLFTYKKKNT